VGEGVYFECAFDVGGAELEERFRGRDTGVVDEYCRGAELWVGMLVVVGCVGCDGALRCMHYRNETDARCSGKRRRWWWRNVDGKVPNRRCSIRNDCHKKWERVSVNSS